MVCVNGFALPPCGGEGVSLLNPTSEGGLVVGGGGGFLSSGGAFGGFLQCGLRVVVAHDFHSIYELAELGEVGLFYAVYTSGEDVGGALAGCVVGGGVVV